MTRFLFPIALTGIILLGIATLLLAKQNWNEKLYGPLLSLAVVGIATAFVTIWLPLKETQEEVQFSTSLALVEPQHLPPMVVPDGALTRVMERLSDLHKFSQPRRLKDGQYQVNVSPPKTSEEITKYCGELLQYAFVSQFHSLQTPHHGFKSLRAADGQQYVSSAAYIPYKLSEVEKIPGSNVLVRLRSNRFSDGENFTLSWQRTALPVPPGTELSIHYIPSSGETGPEKHVVVLEKPQFFSYRIVIEASFGGIGPVSAPSGVKLPSEETRNWQTHTFRIIIRSKFEKLTSGNWRMEEYKAWLKTLTTAIEERWSDVHNAESP